MTQRAAFPRNVREEAGALSLTWRRWVAGVRHVAEDGRDAWGADARAAATLAADGTPPGAGGIASRDALAPGRGRAHLTRREI